MPKLFIVFTSVTVLTVKGLGQIDGETFNLELNGSHYQLKGYNIHEIIDFDLGVDKSKLPTSAKQILDSLYQDWQMLKYPDSMKDHDNFLGCYLNRDTIRSFLKMADFAALSHASK